MKRWSILFILAVAPIVRGFAQDPIPWTLEKCIDYALEHNISVKRQELVKETKEVALSESRWAFSPNVFAHASSSLSTGRVLDQTTYEFVRNSVVGGGSADISGSMGLFNGFRKKYALQRAKLDLLSSTADLESLKYDIRKRIAAAFLAMQCCESDLSSAIETMKLLASQIERITTLLETGRVTESDLLQAKAQAFAAENDVATAEGNLAMARLELCQLLEIEDEESFIISKDDGVPVFPDSLYLDSFITSLPGYRSAELSVEMAKKDISIAKSAYYPSISLSAGYGSSLSTARQKTIQNPDGTFRYEAYPFFEQYVDNANSYLSLGLTIPLFSGMSTNNSVKRARIALKDSEFRLKEKEKTLSKEYRQLFIDCKTSYKKYLSAIQQLKYAEEAERQIRDKYELGVADFNTWNIAATELAKARYGLSEAKYSYSFSVHVLLFFNS